MNEEKPRKPDPFDASNITPENWEPMLKYRKRPIVVCATKLNFPEGFIVRTLEGWMKGKPGDYLVIGIKGEKYPVDKEIFEETYEVIL